MYINIFFKTRFYIEMKDVKGICIEVIHKCCFAIHKLPGHGS